MAPAIEDVDLTNDTLQFVVMEAVKIALATPLREPILAAVENTSDEEIDLRIEDETATIDHESEPDDEATADSESDADDTGVDSSQLDHSLHESSSESRSKPTRTKALQGGLVFVVMFVVMYTVLRRLTNDESE